MSDDRSQSPGRLLVACALSGEADLLAREACLSGTPVIATGLGADRTREALSRFLLDPKPSLFVFTGAAGALDPSLNQGDVVFPEIWIQEGGGRSAAHPPTVAFLRARGWRVEGAGWTARTPVIDWDRRRDLFRDTGALICDMESACALETAERLGVPSIALKVVTDPAISGSPPFTVGAFRRILPHVIPGLAQALNRLLFDLSRRPGV